MESNAGKFNMSVSMSDDELLVFISTNVQQFIKEINEKSINTQPYHQTIVRWS